MPQLIDKAFVSLSRFGAINAGLVYIYFTVFQKVDEEEYGGPWELTKEGFMASFAGFLVCIRTILMLRT